MVMKKLLFLPIGSLFVMMLSAPLMAGPAPDSKRLAAAKDYIADEQWNRAIAELQIVTADAGDPNRDEALFWLAHSQHQVGDQMAALGTIARLERLFPRSRWVRPANSLRIEIAQRLRRDDVLWVLAEPPSTPMPPTAVPAPRGLAPMPSAPTPRATPSQPAPPTIAVKAPLAPPSSGAPGLAPIPSPPPAAETPRPGRSPHAARPTPMTMTMTVWPEGLLPAAGEGLDTDLKIEALVGLLDAHSERVIPLLRDIALDDKNPAEARRAVFALAQSSRPEARSTVVEAATRGPNVVRIAAIREIGRFSEPAFTTTLVAIAKAESDAAVRDTAIVTLGRSGARLPLRTLYTQVPPAARLTVISALSAAKGDDELIRIATTERDPRLRLRARQQLRLLGTPKAVKFLEDNP
jgi:hypothetical protein